MGEPNVIHILALERAIRLSFAYPIPPSYHSARSSGHRSGVVLAASDDPGKEVETVFALVLRYSGYGFQPDVYSWRQHFIGTAPFSFRRNSTVRVRADERVSSWNS